MTRKGRQRQHKAPENQRRGGPEAGRRVRDKNGQVQGKSEMNREEKTQTAMPSHTAEASLAMN